MAQTTISQSFLLSLVRTWLRQYNRELLIPTAGKFQASTNATMRRTEFAKPYVQARLARELGTDFQRIEFPAVTVNVRKLDSFDLQPLGIKLDVEGLEKEVIEGGLKTIARCKPMLMIEMNNQGEFLPMLEALGYRFFRYEPDMKRLIGISASETYLNVICLHEGRPLLPCEMIQVG